MKLCGAEIWFVRIFCVVQVCRSDFFTPIIIKNYPIFSVHDINLASCAMTCYKDSMCLYFVYTEVERRCDGYVKFRNCGDGEDSGTKGRSVDGPVYRRKCIKRCMVGREKTTYKFTFKTGKEQHAASKADLIVGLIGSCGHVHTVIKNGKDVRLRRGRKSTFRFVGDSVCGVDAVHIAFADICHKDSWFIAYVVVEYDEKATGDRRWEMFKTNNWLGVKKGNKHTTGISCIYGLHECMPTQKCEH